MMTAYEFYMGRLRACPSYGFKAGHEILNMIVRCVRVDSMLTEDEYNSIITQVHECHIKLMEDNYNEGWS